MPFAELSVRLASCSEWTRGPSSVLIFLACAALAEGSFFLAACFWAGGKARLVPSSGKLNPTAITAKTKPCASLSENTGNLLNGTNGTTRSVSGGKGGEPGQKRVSVML